MMKGFTRRVKPPEILTEEQIEVIHQGTLNVLQTTGIKLESSKFLKFFEKNGCDVDRADNRVRFPEDLVEDCLRKCPATFRVRARDPQNDLLIGGDTLYFTQYAGMNTVDLNTWEPREATREEYYDYVKVLDALENVHFLSSYPYFGFKGLPLGMHIPEGMAAKIRMSSKCQIESNMQDAHVFCMEMARAVGGEVMQVLESSSPLMLSDEQVSAAFTYGKQGAATRLASGAVSGASAPATIAGSLVSNNAENIASLVMMQLIKPGTRVVARNTIFPQNMRSGSPAFGNAWVFLFQVAFNQIWRRYEIPAEINTIGASSSKKIDFQCGYEKMGGALIAALSGVSLIYFHGGIHAELSSHPVQALLDSDVAGTIGHFIEGFDVSEETLAIDLINQVGPIPGHFLAKEHTRKWWKEEQYVRKVADEMTYAEWTESGKKDCIDYAKERMQEILSTHKVSLPLTPSQEEEIERILKEARECYKKKFK